MKRFSRLSATLHVLVHLAQRPDQAFTSDQLAGWWNTNPVVVRRTFAPLREAGLIRSLAGHGGGWTLARPASEITLGAIYDLLGERLVDLAPKEESPGCLVERAVNRAVHDSYEAANALLRTRLAQITLQDLAQDVATLDPSQFEHFEHTGDPHHAL
jgi:Rrf2 family protein